jgi:hypothetical protein
MMSAIGFDDQMGCDTGEINDVGRYRMLPTKAVSKLATAQAAPEKFLRLGHIEA